jgi:hypothetical protein
MKLPKELRENKDLGNTTTKQRTCSIRNCNEIAIRSLSENKWKSYVEKADLKYVENKQHKIYLCKTHYKESNKYRKSQEKLYQKKGFLDDAVSAGKMKRYDYE